MAKIQTAATYFGWQTLLGNRHERKIGNNTVIRSGTVYNSHDDQTGEPAIEVFLHGNRIAAIRQDDSVQLWNGGWQSHTTKDRLNGILRAMNSASVYQKNFAWYVGAWGEPNRTTDFYNGIRITSQGAIFNESEDLQIA